MFANLARFVYRRRWYVLAVWLLVLPIAASQATQVGKVLGPGDYMIKGSDSQKAASVLRQVFHQNDQTVLLVVMTHPALRYTDPRFGAAAGHVVQRIRSDRSLRVAYLDNPLVSHNPQLLSKDGHGVMLLLSSALKEQDLENQVAHLNSIVKTAGFTTAVTGTAALNHDWAAAAKDDLSRAEIITIPILLIVLLIVFGTVVSACLPLLLAAFTISTCMALVYVIGHFIDTSVYVSNVVTVLGIGIAVDYSLFIVYRFREELSLRGGDVEAAIVRTVETTGRAVFVSGLTVTVALSTLLLTNVGFMVSMGIGGMLVPLVSVTAGLTLLPAVLGILGSRVLSLRILPKRWLTPAENGGWRRLATAIMRHPWAIGTPVAALIVVLALQTTMLNTMQTSLKNAPRSFPSVVGYTIAQSRFPSAPNPMQVVVQSRGAGSLLTSSQMPALRRLEAALRADPAAAHVVGPPDFLGVSGSLTPQIRLQLARYLSPDGRTALFAVVPRENLGAAGSEGLVKRTRNLVVPSMAGPLRSDVIYVGGATAPYIDFTSAIYGRFPLTVVMVLLLTYLFLFFAFRSVLLPLKAVVMNLLSVGAAYGMLQIVFQRGLGASVLSFTPEGGISSWVPIFLFAFLFGLSMDYEVFLLSRIRERWLATRDNTESVAYGLEHTGRLISSAAAIMMIAVSGFLLGQVPELKQMGFGLLAAVALDATLIRIVLVPAIMRIMGDWNWWLPRFLSRFGSGSGREGPTREEDAGRLRLGA